MIFDWYNGGDWGGLPVRRLGHIMADIINAADEVYALLNRGLGIGDSNPLGLLQFKSDTVTKVTLYGAGVDALPTWYDYIPVGGVRGFGVGVTQGDPMRFNYRAALAMFEKLCEAQTEDLPQFLQDDYTSALTMEYLGLGDFDEDSLTRPQQVDVWAAIREAFGKLRYYRGRIRVLTPQEGGGSVVGIGNDKDQANTALVTLWGAASYETGTPRNYTQSFINAATTSPGVCSVSLNDDDSFEVLMRGTDDLNSTPFDRPVMRSYLKFADPAPASNFDFTTDLGNLTAGFEDDFGYAVESVAFESTITRPYYFVDEFSGPGDEDLRARAQMDATCHAVWDIDAEDYPS